MINYFNVIIILIALVYIFIIFKLIKRETLQLKYSLLWIFTSLAILIIAIFPHLIDYLSKIMCIYSPTNALFFLAIFVILIIVFLLTISISQSSDKIKKLAQEVALLKNELKESKESIEN